MQGWLVAEALAVSLTQLLCAACFSNICDVSGHAGVNRAQATRAVTLALHVAAEEVRLQHAPVRARHPSRCQTADWPPNLLGAGQASPGNHSPAQLPLHRAFDGTPLPPAHINCSVDPGV